MDNLPWWFENDLMERSAVAIDEKLGVRYDDRFSACFVIVIICVQIVREEALKKMVQVRRGGPTTSKGHFISDGNPFTV